MTSHLTNPKKHSRQTGFTLVEMTLVMLVGMAIAVMSLTLFNYQLTTYKIINAQNFLIHEAPQVKNSLNRIVSRANFFRLYPTVQYAENGTNATITNATVLALQFRGTAQIPDSYGVIAFDNTNKELRYYHVASMAELTNASDPTWRKSHSWTISSQINAAVFYVENGVLRMKFTGPNGAEIIYSTTTQR